MPSEARRLGARTSSPQAFSSSLQVLINSFNLTAPTTNPTPRIYHFENVPPPAWVDKTTSVDIVNHIVCGSVPSLSPFAVLAPIDVSAQLQQLQVLINSFNLRKPVAKRFTHRVDELRRAWASKHKHSKRRFCHELAELVEAVQKQSGRTLTAAEANQLLTLAALIAGETGC